MTDEITLAEATAIDKLPAIIEASQALATFKERVLEIEVTDDASNAQAVALIGESKARRKDIEAGRVRYVKPLNDHVAMINADAKAASLPWQELENVASYKSSQYVLAESRRREEENRQKVIEQQRQQAADDARLAEQRKLLEMMDGEPEMLPTVAPPVPLPQAPPVPRTIDVGTGKAATQKRVWKVEVIVGHEQEVPDEYCKKVPQQAWLNQALAKGVRSIPGCRIYEDVQTISR